MGRVTKSYNYNVHVDLLSIGNYQKILYHTIQLNTLLKSRRGLITLMLGISTNLVATDEPAKPPILLNLAIRYKKVSGKKRKMKFKRWRKIEEPSLPIWSFHWCPVIKMSILLSLHISRRLNNRLFLQTL